MSNNSTNDSFSIEHSGVDENEKIAVGISACLMGAPVRFNGGHKQSKFCKDTLSQYFDFHSICPEVAIGMSTPRQAIRLVSQQSSDLSVRALGSDDPTLDVTDDLETYAHKQALEMSDLCGYIFMQKSPSCGVFGVKRYLPNGYSEGSTRGIFARVFMEKNPLIPVEEAGRLNDPALRENFMMRVFALHDWKKTTRNGVTAQQVISFHARYKYLVMAHSVSHYKILGALLSDMSKEPVESIAAQYIEHLMQALAKPASRKHHCNALLHLQGYLKKFISKSDKQELNTCIDHYRNGVIPLIVPMTLLKHHLNHHDEVASYAKQQVYLNPHPFELGLRNSV